MNLWVILYQFQIQSIYKRIDNEFEIIILEKIAHLFSFDATLFNIHT